MCKLSSSWYNMLPISDQFYDLVVKSLMVAASYNITVPHQASNKLFTVERFHGCRTHLLSLKNICSYMVTIPILHRGVIASRIISLKKLCMVANHSIKTAKLFHLKKLAMWYLISI